MSIVGAEARANRPPQPEEILKEIPLELFGGSYLGMEGGDLPQGASPFCQDVDFELGAVFTRAMLTAVLSGLVSGSVNYLKSFTLPTGNRQLLVLDSAGNFYYEDTTNNPGVLNKIGTVTPGCFAHSVTAFGREYIAFHNHVTGTDLPRQWDGTNFDPVTQDAPGVPPVLGTITANLPIVSITQPAKVANSSLNNPIHVITWTNGPGLTGNGNIITVYYSLASNLPDPNIFPGANVVLSGFTITSGFDPANGGLAYPIVSTQVLSSGGVLYNTFSVVAVSSFHEVDNVPMGAGYQATLATVTVSIPSPGITPGGMLDITGASPSSWNIAWFNVGVPFTSVMDISNTALAADVATYTFTLPNNPLTGIPYPAPVTGQLVTVQNTLNGGGIFDVTNAPITVSGSTFTVPLIGPNIASAADVGSATTAGTQFTIDPATNAATSASPILGNAGAAGDVAGAGTMAPGTRLCVVMFETRNGFLSRASSPATVNISTATNAITASGIAIGPSDVVRRILAFTGANGAYYFYLATPVVTTTSGVTTTSSATVINDNITTSVTLSFTDADLLSGASIDSSGSNQFQAEILGPCLGVNTFADRMAWWGEEAKIQNLINMSFGGGWALGQGTGGSDVPLGWTSDPVFGAGGSRVANGGVSVDAYQITGNGVNGAVLGMITQPVYQDAFMQPIFNTNTNYGVRIRAKASGAAPLAVLIVQLWSPSLGTVQNATFALNGFTFSTTYRQITGNLANFIVTPAAFPADMVLRIYTLGNVPLGTTVTLGSVEFYDLEEPILTATVRMSYVEDPEQFDGITGFLGIDGLGSRPVTATFELRDTFYVTGNPGLFPTTDTDEEPSFWSTKTSSSTVGSVSVDGVANGEEWVTLSNGLNGEYIFNGDEPMRISQEFAPSFAAATPSAVNTIWKINDITNRRILIGVAINGASLPNIIYMMRYTELNASWEIAEQKPIHVSYSGRMVAWDMSRKWAPWNIVANCAALVTRQDGSKQTWLGNGLNTNKIYNVDPNNTTGDDGLFVNSIYFPFFFVNRDMEQMMQMGLGRKYYDYIRMFIAGNGVLNTTAQSDSMTSPRVKTLAPRTLLSNPGYDMELGVNWTGDRTTFGVQTAALGSWFRLSKLVVTMKQDAWMPKRGRA